MNQFNWNVTLRQPLFAGFGLISRYEMEKLGIDVKKEEKRQAMLGMVHEVKKAYFNVLLAKRLKQTADEVANQLMDHAEDANEFYKQGLIPYNDVLKSQVALADALQKATVAKSKEEMAVSAFNILIGIPIDAKTDVADITTLPPMQDELGHLMEEALQRQPTIQALRLNQKQADLAVRVAKSAYFPNVYLSGIYEQKGKNAAASKNDYTNWQNTGVSIAAQWDLLKWGKRSADVQKRIHERDALSARLNVIEDNVRLEVKKAYLDLKVANENIHTAETTLSQAKESFRITNYQYQESIAASIDVIDARADLTRAETNYYGALYGYQIATADLDLAVGKMDGKTGHDKGKEKNMTINGSSEIKP